MNCRFPPALRLLLLAMLIALPAACSRNDTSAAPAGPQRSAAGLYTVARQDAAAGAPLNTLQAWTLHVEDAAGAAVAGASLEVTGGMPAHNHGLPTAPRVTADLGGGDYRVEGLQFQMPGAWVITVTVDGPAGRDVAVLPFQVAP